MLILESDYEFILRDHDVYNNLRNQFRNSDGCYGYLYSYHEQVFYTEFRVWLEREFKCYNNGTCFLYFKTEADYIWFRLKYDG